MGHRILAGQGPAVAKRPAARGGEDAASRDAKLLQGTWQGVESEYDGKKASTFESRNRLMIFAGDEIVMNGVTYSGPGRRSRFKLDPSRTPKAIDITTLDGNEQDRGKTSTCIYALEKGRLVICYPGNDPEPTPDRIQDPRRRRRGPFRARASRPEGAG